MIKPDLKKILIACIYKPPKGKVDNCIKLLTDLVNRFQNTNYEIWLLGDFNIDFSRRDDVNTVKLNRFIKNLDLSQVIDGITRPNTKGGSRLDLIITDCKYISDSGILNDLIADHYSILSVCKKKRERTEMVVKLYEIIGNSMRKF